MIRLRSHPQAPIERVLLRTCPDGEQSFVEMQPSDASAVCRWWEARLTVTMPLTGYRFLLFMTDGVWWYNGSGLHRHVPTDLEDLKLLADYAAPSWVREAVFYQIFPDRFAQSVRLPRLGLNLEDWESQPTTNGIKRGDLFGVAEHLDYLLDLGINALYFTPVFANQPPTIVITLMTTTMLIRSWVGMQPCVSSWMQRTLAECA